MYRRSIETFATSTRRAIFSILGVIFQTKQLEKRLHSLSEICSTGHLYDVTKEGAMEQDTILKFQPLIGTIVALAAAILSFCAALVAAGLSARTAVAVKNAELKWQRDQAERALEIKRSGFVSWFWLRCGEARELFIERGVMLGKATKLFNIDDALSLNEDSEIKLREQDARESIFAQIAAIDPFYPVSELSTVDLEFLIQLPIEEQRLYSAAVLSIRRADKHIEKFQQVISGAVFPLSIRDASAESVAGAMKDAMEKLLKRITQIRQVEEKAEGVLGNLGVLKSTSGSENPRE